jgi:hypothetical protein
MRHVWPMRTQHMLRNFRPQSDCSVSTGCSKLRTFLPLLSRENAAQGSSSEWEDSCVGVASLCGITGKCLLSLKFSEILPSGAKFSEILPSGAKSVSESVATISSVSTVDVLLSIYWWLVCGWDCTGESRGIGFDSDWCSGGVGGWRPTSDLILELLSDLSLVSPCDCNTDMELGPGDDVSPALELGTSATYPVLLLKLAGRGTSWSWTSDPVPGGATVPNGPLTMFGCSDEPEGLIFQISFLLAYSIKQVSHVRFQVLTAASMKFRIVLGCTAA